MLPKDQWIIGVDGGASRTRAELFFEGGPRFRSESGPSNPGVVGVSGAADAVEEAVDAVLAASGTSRNALTAIGLGIAGIGREDSPLRQDFEAELRDRFGELRVGLWTDQEIALAGAFGGGKGILVIGGTGSGALGFDGQELVRAGGWGRHLRDPGSAYELLREATLFLLSIRDGLHKARSSLCRALPRALGLGSVQDLIPLFARGPSPAELECGVRAISAEADSGDPEAGRLLEEAGRALMGLALAVATRMPGSSHPVVTVGGLFRESERVRESFDRAVEGSGGLLEHVEARAGPELGAAALAVADRASTSRPLPLLLNAVQRWV